MKIFLSIKFFFAIAFVCGQLFPQSVWIIIPEKNYEFQLTQADSLSFSEYKNYFDSGVERVEKYFDSQYEKIFVIKIHPDRNSLDAQWQKDWGVPDFKSECWMVASGVAHQLDIIAPNKWDSLSCEHKYSNKIAVENLITHELVHVFHGQKNISPDFSNTDNIDWFVEGLACYASGQLDATRIDAVKLQAQNGKLPDALNKLWSGKNKYGLSGSMLMFIDNKYGRKKIFELLQYNSAKDILAQLNCSEEELILEWKKFIKEM